MRCLLSTTLCGVLAVVAAAQEPAVPAARQADPKKGEAVREISLKGVTLPAEEKASVDKPTVITGDDELKKAVGDEGVKAVGKVDFKKEHLLLFRWSGSGQDKLTPSEETKDKKATVTFTWTPGFTKDLREHAVLFAIPADAGWKYESAIK
jgi:hypothetical protein